MLSHVVNITLHSVSITWCKLWQQFGWQLLYWNGCTSYASRLPFHWLRLIQRITLWCPPLPANFLKRELPQPSSLRRVTLRSIGCLQVIAVGLRLLSTQVYKPLFPAFFSQFLDFSPYEQHIFCTLSSSLCFLGLVDLSIHKRHKTHASWVSNTDSYGEKNHFLPSSCILRVFRITCLQTTYILLNHSAQLLLKSKFAQITRRQEMSM